MLRDFTWKLSRRKAFIILGISLLLTISPGHCSLPSVTLDSVWFSSWFAAGYSFSEYFLSFQTFFKIQFKIFFLFKYLIALWLFVSFWNFLPRAPYLTACFKEIAHTWIRGDINHSSLLIVVRWYKICNSTRLSLRVKKQHKKDIFPRVIMYLEIQISMHINLKKFLELWWKGYGCGFMLLMLQRAGEK